MVRPHAALALCLLSLVAASVAQDDPGTVTRADPVTEAVSYYEVMSKLPGKIRCRFTTHRCQHQRTKKRDKVDEKA